MKRRRLSTGLLLIVVCLIGVFIYWRLGDRQARVNDAAQPGQTGPLSRTLLPPSEAVVSASTAPMVMTGLSATNATVAGTNSSRDLRLKYRVSNTTRTVGQLARSDHAILLANALIDSGEPLSLAIPDSLRAQGEPGAYIVQARGPTDAFFRAQLKGTGASVVSYIPNNAWLVRASADAARRLASLPGTQAVIPFEPYYKLDPRLLALAVEQLPLPAGSTLNVVAFPDEREVALAALTRLGVEVVGEDRSPFGPVFKIRTGRDSLTTLAGLAEIQTIGLASVRKPANDLSRASLAVSTNSVTTASYRQLTGVGVRVSVNDSGIDETHPDLFPRVSGFSLTDPNGHGTHVAGIIASSGASSQTVTNASGSIMPPVDFQFRGKAPSAELIAVPIDGPNDLDLQEAAARADALISNNSWNYGGSDYDIAAASFDAAVRDSMPTNTGSQSVVYVFSAGNAGNGFLDGTGVSEGSILSPATAKNVLTVGAVEQLRNITNEIQIVIDGVTNLSTPWRAITDSQTQVASFSSRGNVGVDLEGEFGRFKPDVVAPGTFVVSTTQKSTWDQAGYYNPTNYHFNTFQDRVDPHAIQPYPIFLPFNTVQWQVGVTSLDRVLGLPIYIKSTGFPTTADTPVSTNFFFEPSPNPVDAFWFYGIGNPTNLEVRYEVTTMYATTNDNGNYFTVLSNMNYTLGPFYRYESGTSMAAAEASGVLALMGEYFADTAGPSNPPSPALMKALLINGARSLNAMYDLQVRRALNDQGWGLINLTNSLPLSLQNGAASPAPASMLYFDQNPTNCLSTGNHRTFNLTLDSVDTSVREQPLRVTLVWTDPPGNPAAGIKLVNDLDLVVSNSDNTNQIFIGNNIPPGSIFNFPISTNSPPVYDNVNNVENVFLLPPIGTNYSITVYARNVNVNAVTAETNRVAQDFALVISVGDGSSSNAITLSPLAGLVATNYLNVTIVTNDFVAITNISGQLLLNQHVGADTPLLGTNMIDLGPDTVWGQDGTNGAIVLGLTNQWHFYIMTNTTTFAYAAFATFLPSTLSMPRMGVTNYGNLDQATRVEADIDLFVARGDPGMLTLDDLTMLATDKSVRPGGTELITYSNALPGEVFYIGVHSPDRQAAEYAFFGVFSKFPFSTTDSNGVQSVYGINAPAIIPDGTPKRPGGALVVGIALQPMLVRRVVVTNSMSHENFGDLFGHLHHERIPVALNNHSCVENLQTASCFTNYTYIYEDAGENDIVGSQHTDGPGRLTDYMGTEGAGLWLMTQVDNAFGSTGKVNSVSLRLEPLILPDGSLILNIQPNSFGFATFDVPPEATNFTICVQNESGTPLPLELYVRRDDLPTRTQYDYFKAIPIQGTCLTISKTDLPPLRAGRYFIGVFNPNPIPQTVRLTFFLGLSLNGVPTLDFNSTNAVRILDDAVTYSSIYVNTNARIVRAEVGVSLRHPRISDLALTLISPSGKRVLLFENRGGPDAANLGGGGTITNFFGTQIAGGAITDTNVIGPVATSGTLVVDYEFFPLWDTMDVYYEGLSIFSSGSVSNSGTFTIPYGPGTDTSITIVMNLGTNPQPTTAWNYTPRVISQDVSYFVFSNNTNNAFLPIKFAINARDPGENYSLDDFEAVPTGDYIAPTNLLNWTVSSNRVSVVDDPFTAQAPGSRFLALADGILSTNLTVVPGGRYILSYNYRGPAIADWWRGEQLGTNTIDSIGGNNGIPNGSPAIQNGVVGQGFKFDGANSYIEVPHNPSLDFSNAFTLEMWYRDDSGLPDYGLIAKRADGSVPANYGINILQNPVGLGVYYNDTNYTSPGNLSDDAVVGSPYETSRYTNIPPANVFHHLAAVYEQAGANAVRILTYIDGQQVRTKIMPGDLAATFNTNSVFIGASDLLTAEFMNGMLDEVSIYRRALSGAEIHAIYSRTNSGKFDSSTSVTADQSVAKAEISLSGIRADTFYGNNLNWQTRAMTFTPGTNTVSLQLTGLEPGMLLDSLTVTRLPEEFFVLPESSLNDLVGDNAGGLWTLEIWDNRAGLPGAVPVLESWQLRFILEDNSPAITPLFDRIPVTNTAPACAIAYYYVDVPSWVTSITNRLLFADAPVNLWFNQNTPPTGTNFGDFAMLTNSTIGSYVLSSDTNSPPPLLVPGSRYYLAVENPCANGSNVTFAIEVDFGAQFIRLTNMVPYVALNAGTNSPYDYYIYEVSTNAARAQFEIRFPTDRMMLVARLGLPPPAAFFNDYTSTNPGFNDELIVVFSNSVPIALAPGDWYLTAINISGAPVNYSIMASEWPETGRPFSITNVSFSTNGFCLTWTTLPFIHYYVEGVQSLPDLTGTNWYTLSHTLTALTNDASQCISLPSPFQYFRIVEGLALEDVPHPPPAVTATAATNGVRFDWLGSVTTRYVVQWTPTLTTPPPVVWNNFTNIATSTDGVFSFLDDGTQTGGFTNAMLFYRLQQIVVP